MTTLKPRLTFVSLSLSLSLSLPLYVYLLSIQRHTFFLFFFPFKLKPISRSIVENFYNRLEPILQKSFYIHRVCLAIGDTLPSKTRSRCPTSRVYRFSSSRDIPSRSEFRDGPVPRKQTDQLPLSGHTDFCFTARKMVRRPAFVPPGSLNNHVNRGVEKRRKFDRECDAYLGTMQVGIRIIRFSKFQQIWH